MKVKLFLAALAFSSSINLLSLHANPSHPSAAPAIHSGDMAWRGDEYHGGRHEGWHNDGYGGRGERWDGSYRRNYYHYYPYSQYYYNGYDGYSPYSGSDYYYPYYYDSSYYP